MAINQVVIPGRLAKKRKSSGRAKGGAGHKGTVQCSRCGRLVPADKAKKYTKMSSSVEPQIARELRQQGSYIPSHRVTAYYCVSCAVHSGKVHIRDTRMRKSAPTH
jgi:small subunit ribosomal protein S26e